MGIINKSKVISEKEENRFITFIWSCTNFLAPKTNGLLSSSKSSKKPCYYTWEHRISSSCMLFRQIRRCKLLLSDSQSNVFFKLYLQYKGPRIIFGFSDNSSRGRMCNDMIAFSRVKEGEILLM